MVTSLIFSTDDATRGQKTIYYQDAIGVQFKPSGIVDGYIQVETAAGNMTGKSSAYDSENAIQFGKYLNDDAEKVANFISKKIDECKSNSGRPVVQNSVSVADELLKFKQLLDMGVLTQEEFDAKKKELLGL